MSLGELDEPWGQLVSTELPPGAEEERIPVLGNTFLIGRAKGQLLTELLTHWSSRPLTHNVSFTHSLTQMQTW